MDRIINKFKQLLFRIKPRIYVCSDVIMIRWMDFEIIIPRLYK